MRSPGIFDGLAALGLSISEEQGRGWPMSGGPLAGLRVVEIASIGPGPFAAMMLADMGAEVLRIERPDNESLIENRFDVTLRGRPAIDLDLGDADGVERVLGLAERVDVLLEGFRPGVMERLGLGPDVVVARNPRLVYGRMTGYGQDGPMTQVAGHDINYISVAGTLSAMARAGERPLAPLNLVGDYGGGGMLLAFGVVCGVWEAQRSGVGQVIDASMVDGAALLPALIHGLRASGMWSAEPGTNVLDSGAHFYETYATADGCHVAVGAVEPQFYARLLELIEVDAADAPQWDRELWPELKQRFAAVFATRTAADWQARLEGEEACATVVQSMAAAPEHEHNVARGTFVELDGVVQPQAAPRFSRTPGGARPRPASAAELLDAWAVDPALSAR
ncbi:MAG: CaiB/BaiF CoA transferase family protein [Solirubrobacterales bacterium]